MKSYFCCASSSVALLLSIAIAGCGGGSGSSGGGNLNNPVPTVGSLSPSSAPQDSTTFTLTVTGSGFISSSQIQWAGASLTTTFASATTLTAQIPATDLSATGSFDVKVLNPAPGGGSSNSAAFTVGNPVPVLTSISPNSAAAGGAGFTLTATGSDFISTSVIRWNGANLATTFVSGTQVTAQVPAADLAATGSNFNVSVTVLNPTPNGGASSGVQFSVLEGSGAHMVTINLTANDIGWDATHSKIYASLPSTAAIGNSVVAIDPVTAAVGTPVSVGSEPRPLALSSDNSFLYVGLDGSGQIKRLNLPALTVDTSLNIQFPIDTFSGAQEFAITLSVAPGAPHTIAAIFDSTDWGTAIYDDAVMRGAPLTRLNNVYDTSLEWNPDASTLYANDGITTGNDLFVMSVTAGGLSLKSDYGYLVPSQYGRLHYDQTSKYLYVTGAWWIRQPGT